MITFFLLLATGVFAGTLGGLFGIGGGIVIMPVLYLIFTQMGVDPDLATKTAVGTSLATIIVTSLRSMRAHHQKGAVDFDVLKFWAPFIALGAVFGAVLARSIDGQWLLALFAIGVVGIGIQRLRGTSDNARTIAIPKVAQRVLAVGTGLFSSLTGIGGGVIGVLILTFAGRPMHQAVGTASGFGVAIAVPGAIGFALAGLGQETIPGAIGFVHLLGFVGIASGTAIFAPVGARLAHRLSADKLSAVFGVYLLITGALLLREVFTAA